MTIKSIVAIDLNNAIGYKNELLYKVPEDLKRFKELTTGHHVLMGRKTLESLPNQYLPHRNNIVLTTDKNYKPKDSRVCVMNDFSKIINHYTNTGDQDKDLWIIGGAQIYEQFFDVTEEFHITVINDCAKKADKYYPIERLFSDKSIILSSSETIYSPSIDAEVTFNIYKRLKEQD